MPHPLTEPLFHQAPLSAVLENQKEAVRKAVEQVPPDRMREDDEAAIVSDLFDRFVISPIQFTEGAISAEAEEAQVDVSGSWDRDTMDGGTYYVPGVRVSYFVPFVGDKALFNYQPNTYSFHFPRADVLTGELLFRFEDPDSNVGVTKSRFDDEFRLTKEWTSWANQDVERFNADLRPTIARLVEERRMRLRQLQSGTINLGIPIRSSKVISVRPEVRPTSPTTVKAERYDVALSFAGEDRAYVEKVADALKAHGVKVFYDAHEQVGLWGKNLVDHLAEVYQNRSRFVVMFVSRHYVQKAWPTHERQHAQSRALLAKEEYILPARFDDTEVPGMTSTVAYVDLRNVTQDDFIEMIRGKLS